MSEEPRQLQKFMRMPAVKEATGLSDSSIWALVAEGKFPKPVPLVGRRTAWIESEIAEWQRARIADRDGRSIRVVEVE